MSVWKFMGIAVVCLIVVAATAVSISVIFRKNNGDGTKTKLLIDSDGGVDDAMAILMMLSDKNKISDVTSISTVFGNAGVENVTQNILTLLDIFDKKIPVHMGISVPILSSPVIIDDPSFNQHYYGYDGFGDVLSTKPPLSDASPAPSGVLNIIDTVKKHPGVVTLLCLGPLTNIATAIRLYPNLLAEIKEMYVMGSSVEGKGNLGGWKEYNIVHDAEAAQIVFNNCKYLNCKMFVLGWEPSLQSGLTMGWRKNTLGKIGSKQMDFINSISKHLSAIDDSETWTDVDGFLAAILLSTNNDLVLSTKRVYIKVSTCPEDLRGSSFVQYDEASNIQIYTSLNRTALEAAFIEYLK